MTICSHQWVDPRERFITKATYSPIIGPLRRQMKPDTLYRCNNCDAVLKTAPPRSDETGQVNR
jgi:hypothetical protein